MSREESAEMTEAKKSFHERWAQLHKITPAILENFIEQFSFSVLFELIHHSPAKYLIKHEWLDAYWLKELDRFKCPLQRHRFNNQPETIADQRNPFDILAGVYCYDQSNKAKIEMAKKAWLQLGAQWGDFLCMSQLNLRNILEINDAAIRNKELNHEKITTILKRAERAAALHGAAGYALLAETCYILGSYFAYRFLRSNSNTPAFKERWYAPSTNCHRLFPPEARILSKYFPNPDLHELSTHHYSLLRDAYYGMALKAITMAIELEPHCEAITHNATLGSGLSQQFHWRYSKGKSLAEAQDYFKELLRVIKRDYFIRPLVQEGRETAGCIIESMQSSLPRRSP